MGSWEDLLLRYKGKGKLVIILVNIILLVLHNLGKQVSIFNFKAQGKNIEKRNPPESQIENYPTRVKSEHLTRI